MIDADKIIKDTLHVFNQTVEQRKKFSEITEFISADDYSRIHKGVLTPLNIKIDVDLFLQEIETYKSYFEQWGTEHTHLPRYGLALVNEDGMLKSRDVINGSLYEKNKLNPNTPVIETDFTVPTEVMNLSSLKPLSVFDGHWCRSNVFKWYEGAEFMPHIDTVIPSPWIRLWAATSTDNIDVRFYNGEMVSVENIEAGRVYVIDTSIVHDAKCKKGTVFQLFLSVRPSALGIIADLM